MLLGPIGISGSSVDPMCLGKSGREELSVGKGEFEENGSEGEPYTSASVCGKARCIGTSVWHSRRAHDCQPVLKRSCARKELQHVHYTAAPVRALRNHVVNRRDRGVSFLSGLEVISFAATPEIEKCGSHYRYCCAAAPFTRGNSINPIGFSNPYIGSAMAPLNRRCYARGNLWASFEKIA